MVRNIISLILGFLSVTSTKDKFEVLKGTISI